MAVEKEYTTEIESTHNTTEVVGEEHAAEEVHGEEEHLVHEVTLYAEPIAHVGNFTITNALATSWVVVLIIIVISLVLRKSMKEVPGKIQSVFEMIVEAALGLFDQVTNSRETSLKIFPIAISAFFFILINNWLGIMPFGGFGQIHNGEHGLAFIPFLRGGTADINTTIALSVIAVLGANLFGVFSIGLWKTFNKYVNIKVLGEMFTKVRKNPTVVIVSPITFFVGLIEIAGEFAKIASLSFRLFGNILAGEVLLASIAALLAYAAPLPFLFLEILVGVIQALIFSMLLVVYFSVASLDHDHDESHEESSHEHHEKKEYQVA